MISLWDSVLDQIDADPTLMPEELPEFDVIPERSFDLGFACSIDPAGAGGAAFSEILLHLDEEARVRPGSTAAIIATIIDGMCRVDAMDWSAAAKTVCNS